jgi:hypothetical protein
LDATQRMRALAQNDMCHFKLAGTYENRLGAVAV